MKKIILVAMALTASGCSWQKIPPDPTYITNDTIPVKVGLTGKSTEAQMIDGLATEMKSMRLFDSITYPYRQGDPVDLVMDVEPSLTADTGGNFGRGFLIGATFFTLSPFMGPKIEYAAETTASFKTPAGKEVANMKVADKSEVEFGLGADINAVRAKSRKVVIERLADSLAKKVRESKQSLVSGAKSQ